MAGQNSNSSTASVTKRRGFPVSKVLVCSNSPVAWFLSFGVLGILCLWMEDRLGALDSFYLFALLINVFAGILYLGLIPRLANPRKDEEFSVEDGVLRWSAGEEPLSEIRKVVLFTKPDGDVRKMRITSRRLFLNFRNSMEEYKPLADRLREELPEERFRVYQI